MSNDSISEVLAPFPVQIVIPVAWGEMDAMQHVNNTVYFRYMETARFAYFERLEWLQRSASWIGPILGSIRCRFKFPLTYPDRVHVGAKVTQVEQDRFTMCHRLVSERHGRVAAQGESVLVVFDYGHNRKAERLPAEIVSRLDALERNLPRLAD